MTELAQRVGIPTDGSVGCADCGTRFEPRAGSGGRRQVYCSPECRHRANNSRRKDRERVGKPAAPRRSRRPLPEFAKDAAWRLRADVERIERIFADDRFGSHKEQVAALMRSHLAYTAEVCQDLLSRIDHPKGE